MEKVTRNFGLTIVMLLMAIQIMAQVPNAFKYQAVLRNTLGQILSNQTINLRASVIRDNPNGTTVYSEGFNQIKTNLFGIINLEIGRGQVYYGDFSKVDWGNGIYFVKIDIDLKGNGVYEVASNSQLLAVPYALYAGNTPLTITGSGSVHVTGTYPNYNIYTPIWDSNSFAKEYQTLSLKGNILSISHGNSVTLPLGNNGSGPLNTISLPTNNGDIAFWQSGTWVGDDILFWDETALKMGIGTSSPAQQLDITQNFQIPNTTSSTGIIYKNGSTFIHNYGTNNTFTGINSGNLSLTGTNMTGIGYEALFSNTSGSYNSAFGSKALYTNTSGYGNTGIGYMADVSSANLINATAIGYGAIATSNYEMRLGNSNVTSLYCQGAYYPVTSDIPNMVVEPNGQILRSITTTSLLNLSGDVTGPYNTNTVSYLQGNPIALGAPAPGQTMMWYNGAWIPTSINGVDISVDASSGTFILTNTAPNATHTGDVSGAGALWINSIQNYKVNMTPGGIGSGPSDGQALIWSDAVGALIPHTVGTVGGTGTAGYATYWTGPNDIEGSTNYTWDNNNKVLAVTGNINLNSSGTGTGIIQYNGSPWIYNYGTTSFFAGINAGNQTTTGTNLIGIGPSTLNNNVTGISNIGIGFFALWSNTTGCYNIGIGDNSLSGNINGSENTAIGYETMENNTSANYNTALGNAALPNNTTGDGNTAIGTYAIFDNTTGIFNTGCGFHSLADNTTGQYNVGIGTNSLYHNTTGQYNTAIGYGTDINSGNLSNVIVIGYDAEGTTNDQIVLGNNYVSSLYCMGVNGTTTTYLPNLYVNSTGQIMSSITTVEEPYFAGIGLTLTGNTFIHTTHTGDAIGQTDLIVIGLQRYPISPLRPTSLQTLYWNGNIWTPTSIGCNVMGSGITNGVTFWAGNNNISGDANLYWDNTNKWLGIGCVPNQQLDITKNFQIQNTTSGVGIIYKTNNTQSYPFIHNYGTNNTFMGINSGNLSTTGTDLIGIGNYALNQNTNGTDNIGIGYNSLNNNSIGSYNIALGTAALESNTNGNRCISIGNNTLQNQTGSNDINNIAIGYNTLNNNLNGINNIGIGYEVLNNNNSDQNLAIGYWALLGNLGTDNIAIGNESLLSNDEGSGNTAIGYYSLYDDLEGNTNISIGANSMQTNVNGSYNICIGYHSDVNQLNLTNTIVIGYDADGTTNDEVVLGNSNTSSFVCMGATFPTSNAANMYVDPNTGEIMRSTSSIRYKENVTDLAINTSGIYELRPVSYTSKIDNGQYFGLIAEEVAGIFPELVEYTKSKNVISGSKSDELIPDAVKYPMLSVLLLKEVQKHNNRIYNYKNNIDKLKQQVKEIKSQEEEYEQSIFKLNTNIDKVMNLLKKKNIL